VISLFQRLIAELNKEQEAFIASKQTGEKVEAVAPWVGAPNEDALREECLSLSTVSNLRCLLSLFPLGDFRLEKALGLSKNFLCNFLSSSY
jgi:hypothetical protein